MGRLGLLSLLIHLETFHPDIESVQLINVSIFVRYCFICEVLLTFKLILWWEDIVLDSSIIVQIYKKGGVDNFNQLYNFLILLLTSIESANISVKCMMV